jgi:hypothetical protein
VSASSPTPWRIQVGSTRIVGPANERVCAIESGKNARGDALLIVEAVNRYPQVRAALTAVYAWDALHDAFPHHLARIVRDALDDDPLAPSGGP